MQVPASEHGHARVFAVDLDPERAEALTPDDLAAALGIETLDMEQVELFPIGNLAGLGLSSYLVEGMGMDVDQVRPDASRLDGLRGHVLILLSNAVKGRTLEVGPPLRWIGTYSEPTVIAPMEKLRADAAEGTLDETRKPPSDAAIGGRIAVLVLLVLFALVLVMILIS
ncbi:hypothetical protein [Pelagovum pacificum]|nr:hypothetical protein [Pelagovum pacificum]